MQVLMQKDSIMKRITILIFISLITLASCDFLDPYPIVDLDDETLWSNAEWGEGILTEAYTNLNTAWDINLDYYTDNAVPSNAGGNILALGGWTVENSPIGDWAGWYNTIKYLNYYIQEGEDLVFSVSDPVKNQTLQKNRIGEAYFLRAWYQWQLLQTYGGMVNGQAMGFPIVTTVLKMDDDLDLPRNTYEECVAQIVSDLDEAISILPFDYSNGNDAYTGLVNRGRGSASAALALKAKVYLYAASPAFGNSNQATWVRAAEAAYNAIDSMGGLNDLEPYGNFNDGANFDYIWISPGYNSTNYLERAYYPPSLYGNGQCNPSQNLVDAFPAQDGFPTTASAVFDADEPFAKRDPRLNRFIFHNGDNYNGTFVRTYEGGPDAPGGLSQQGTRTGYYMKKQLSYNVRLTPGDVTSDITFKVYLSKTDLYLAFAEAANEAYGPTDASLGFSALDVMRVIRERAGIDSDPATSGYQDLYLDDQAAAGVDAFRTLIQNERRLELCFEESRFWDIRRWNLPLNHTVQGVELVESAVAPTPVLANIALASEASADFVSPYSRLSRINNDRTSGSAFHNWPSAGEWRYVQYDFPEYFQVPGTSNAYLIDSTVVQWWEECPTCGVQYPDSVYLEVWDSNLGDWVEVWSDYDGVTEDYWPVPFSPAENTTSIRLNFKDSNASCGIKEWYVWGVPATPVGFEYQLVNVEDHTYQDYMRFIPLPYSQTLIMNNLTQNTGW